MAYPSASGHGNLPNGSFSPVVYSKKVLKFFKIKSVADEITNTDFEGEITQMGDTVKIIKQPIVSTGTYQRGTILSTQDLVDEDLSMVIDQGKYYQFGMDDIERAHQHVSFEDMATDSAAYALKNGFDSDILTVISAGATAANVVGSSGSEETVGYGAGNDFTPLNIINRLSRLLDEQNIPEDGRWFVAAPAFYEALGDEDSKLIDIAVTGDPTSLLRDVKVATSRPVHGFTMFKSNNTPENASGNPLLLAGHVSAVATATSILTSEKLRNPNTFGDLYRGLLVYGRKVLRPSALAVAHVTIGNL